MARPSSTVRVDPQGRYVPGSLMLVGPREIRVLFRVASNTPAIWHTRGVLPTPDDHLSGTPVWHLRAIARWGQQTGRKMWLAPESAERLDVPQECLGDPSWWDELDSLETDVVRA